jgi:hypothetical protein
MTVTDIVHASTSDPIADAVFGENTGKGAPSRGLHGRSVHGAGVFGESTNFIGVAGESAVFDGVFGTSHHNPGAGVSGHNDGAGPGAVGVFGESRKVGSAPGAGDGSGDGVVGVSGSGRGIIGVSRTFVGIWAESKDKTKAGLFATNNKGAGLAARFEGDVEVTGDIRLTGQDLAENFEISTRMAEPGTVMVINNDGSLRESHQSYDKRVAGIVSGAGDFRPAIILGKHGTEPGVVPIALFGRAFCKVDAEHCPVETGDLLTTSSTPGHAMKAVDQTRAFGTVIGKALQPLAKGQGLIPILIALQ